METNSSPFGQVLAAQNDDQAQSLATKYRKGNKKIDKNTLSETRKQLTELKKISKDVYNEVTDESKDEKRITKRVKFIEEYFKTPEDFKKFQEKISKTTENTINAYESSVKAEDNEDRPDKKAIESTKNCIAISEDLLKDVKKDQGDMYWKYMNRPYIKGTDVEQQIIGSSENSYEILDYTQKSLDLINEYSIKDDDKDSKDNKENEEPTPSGPSTGAQNGVPYNKYMDYSVEKITDAIKNMSAHYDKELLNKLDELNKQCHAEINTLREELRKLNWGKTLLNTEQRNPNQNQDQNSPLEYLVTLDKITERVTKGKQFFPLTPMPMPKPKPALPTTLPPDKRGGATNGTTTVQNDNNSTPAALPTAQGDVMPINAEQTTVPPAAQTTIAEPAVPINNNGESINAEQPNVPVVQSVVNENPAPPTTLSSSGTNNALASAQASSTPEKSEQENSNQPAFTDISELKDKKTFDEVKNEIIDKYCEKLSDAYNKLMKEFHTEQMDAFSALLEAKNKTSSSEIESFQRGHDNIQNATTSSYNFDTSVERFLRIIDEIIPPPAPLNPPKHEDLAPRISAIFNKGKNKNTGAGQAAKAQNATPSSETAPEEAAKAQDATTSTTPSGETAPEEAAKAEGDDNYEDGNNKEEAPENFKDIITGKIYQSDFLQEVADSLLPLYKYMQKYLGNDKGKNTDETDEDEEEDTKDNASTDEDEDDDDIQEEEGKKGKGILSRVKNIFRKKNDDTNAKALEESDMENLIKALYATNDSNIYNLRLLHQKETVSELADAYGVDKSTILGNYYSGKLEDKYSGRDKKEDIGGTKLNGAEERFQYTRAILRAFICIRNDITDITSNNGATQTNVQKNLSEGIYKNFLNDLMLNKRDATAIRTTCEKYLGDCRKTCEDSKDNHDYTFLLKCIKNVLNGTKYNDSDLREALKNNKIPETEGIAQNIRTETTWLFNGEAKTELNLQLKEIDQSLKSK